MVEIEINLWTMNESTFNLEVSMMNKVLKYSFFIEKLTEFCKINFACCSHKLWNFAYFYKRLYNLLIISYLRYIKFNKKL